jgi:hypothetical protein
MSVPVIEKNAAYFEERSHIISESGCWVWQLNCFHDGYGMYGNKFYKARAHRGSYEAHKGAIPDGMIVMHTCDVRCCVNPDHLEVGTNSDNMRDMMSKGRGNGQFKLGRKAG